MRIRTVGKVTEKQFRASEGIEVRVSGDDADTFIFPLSSEEPYGRPRGAEILVHSAEAVDLKFLNSGSAPLLDSHDRWSGLQAQIGVVKRAWIEKKRLYVEVKFSRKTSAQEIKQDVIDGIVRNVSVGYEVHKIEVDTEGDSYRVTRWKPVEASFVPIPADPTVGMGRASATVMEGNMPEQQATMPDPNAVRAAVILAETAEATREINALAATHNKRDLADTFVEKAMKEGKVPSLAEFRGVLRAALPADVPLVNRDIGLNTRERRQFSIIRLARHMAGVDAGATAAARFEIEACEAAANNAEGETRGYRLPTDIMDSWDLRAAMSTSANPNVQSTDHLASRFIESLRNQSTVLRMGVTVLGGLDGNLEIPGGDTNASAAWLASEDANAAETVPTFRKVTMSVKDVAAYTDLTRRMLQQSTIDIEMYVRDQLTRAMVEAIDLAGLQGSGAAGVPRGVKNTVGIGAVTFAAANPTWGEIVDLETDVAVANALMGNTGYLGTVAMRGHFKQTLKATGVGGYIMERNTDGLNGYEYAASNAVTSGDLFFGNWADLLMGLWGSLDLDRDTAAKFLSGGIRIRAIQSVDFAVARVGSFSLGNDGV